MKRKSHLICFFLFAFFYNFIFCLFFVFAADNSSKIITATIKISICGNSIIEGGEDCEGNNLGNAGCQSLGYGGGNLTCDIACSFDTTNCIGLIPTSTPTPSSTPTSQSTSTPQQAVTQALTSQQAVTVTPQPKTLTAVPAPILSVVVTLFDTDGSGRIETREVFQVVKNWVQDWEKVLGEEISGKKVGEEKTWSQICDVNFDKTCNLLDFSILLYYIER